MKVCSKKDFRLGRWGKKDHRPTTLQDDSLSIYENMKQDNLPSQKKKKKR